MTTSTGYLLPPPPPAPQAPKKSHAWLWAILAVVVVFGLTRGVEYGL
jgi:hypothetical protein